MKNSYLTNVILLLVIIAGLYWLNKPIQHTPQKTLSSLNASQVKHILIQRQNLDDIELNKITDGWYIIQPIQAKANNTRVNLLLSTLTTPSLSQFQPSLNDSIQQFGFDPTTVILQLNDQQFEFGAIEPLSKHRYVRYQQTVHLINDTIAPLLNSNASSFIDNQLIANNRHIKKLQLPTNSSANQNLTINMIDGHWQSKPDVFSADTLTTLIDNWQHAHALQVIPLSDKDIAKLTGDPITIWFKDEIEQTEFILHENETMLFISNLNHQLKYQFPIAIKQQLFPIVLSKEEL